ncbi:BatD family protein [Pseudomonas mangrovi]|uniref:Protein BatD n=1 Tax=Pseudomonas mangrovi TaxID=2161748 RepID=A0A2T5PAV1_9PSED|nr:BatD family protein [Pseudomonas mangrovi]PTU74870.1 protein BatD [Pseudomonas mangrovi]
MSRVAALLFSLLLAWVPLAASAEELIASVDRNRLGIDETVELTLEAPDGTLFDKLDLAPLKPLFDVLGTRQVNRLSTLEGQTRVVTRWIITLQPRNQGFVVIPPLRVGNRETQAITLQVVAAERASDGSLAPIFIDASLDSESVYVQAQALLTLRIFHSVSLYDDSSLTPLQVADARVEQLGEPRTYEQIVNGVRHGVIELRYAIFPLKSGQLTLPSQVFSATPVLRNRNELNPFGPRPGTLTRVRSPQIPLTVKPIPAGYPQGAPWLPARSLTLEESWNPSPEALLVGDSLTRTLRVVAEGLASVQLPPLKQPDLAGLRNYPDQPRLDDSQGDGGITGSREESLALVPTRSDSFVLPDVELFWWNTESDRLERAILAPRTLNVADNPQLDDPRSAAPEPPTNVEQVLLWPWQLGNLLLACSTLLGFALWWRARRQPAVQRSAQSGPSPRTLLDEIKRACQANDPHATRQALDAWARQFPETLAEMAARYAPLSDALDGLNGALYSEIGQLWQGDALWQAVRSLPAPETAQTPGSETSQLPPLYPR